MLLEICCYNLASALTAQQAGAQRIELCADPANGGTTPALGLIRMARKKLEIPLYTIVRARGGDFLFSDDEFEIMLHDVAECKRAGCDGIVTGVLQVNGKVDKKKCAQLIHQAYPMGVTFHRAFDWAENPFEALEDIISLGCERILTSGQQPTAILGAGLIADLIQQAGDRIVIMPGSGIRAINIEDLAKKTGATEFHSSASVHLRSSMGFVNPSMNEDQLVVMADAAEIRGMLDALSRL